jgi:hypothetical protein
MAETPEQRLRWLRRRSIGLREAIKRSPWTIADPIDRHQAVERLTIEARAVEKEYRELTEQQSLRDELKTLRHRLAVAEIKARIRQTAQVRKGAIYLDEPRTRSLGYRTKDLRSE